MELTYALGPILHFHTNLALAVTQENYLASPYIICSESEKLSKEITQIDRELEAKVVWKDVWKEWYSLGTI